VLDETGGEQSIFRLVAALAVEAGDSGGAVVAYVGSRPSIQPLLPRNNRLHGGFTLDHLFLYHRSSL